MFFRCNQRGCRVVVGLCWVIYGDESPHVVVHNRHKEFLGAVIRGNARSVDAYDSADQGAGCRCCERLGAWVLVPLLCVLVFGIVYIYLFGSMMVHRMFSAAL